MNVIEVLSRTQKIVVSSTRAVSVINAGPIGPGGPQGIDGPEGPEGPIGETGVVDAEAPLIYDNLLRTLSLDQTGLSLNASQITAGVFNDALIPATVTRDSELDQRIIDTVTTLENGAPALLNQFNELAAALNNDPDFAASINAVLATKATIAGLDQEITDRQAGDAALLSDLGDEILRATDAEAALVISITGVQDNLTAEALTRGNADTVLTDAIAAEATARGDADALLVTLGTTQTITAPKTLQAQAVGDVPLIIQGAAGQTADLQQWQDSAGTILSKVSSAGVLTFPVSSGDPGTLGSIAANAAVLNINGYGNANDGSGSLIQTWNKNAAANFLQTALGGTVGGFFRPAAAAGVGVIVKGFTSQSSSLQEWQDSAGTSIASVNSVGDILTNGRMRVGAGTSGSPSLYITGDTNTGLFSGGADQIGVTVGGFERLKVQAATPNVLITAAGAAFVPLQIKAAASQSANLTEWLDSAGVLIARMGTGGGYSGPRMGLGGFIVQSTITAAIQPTVASDIALAVRGAASQTGDLQRWQNSAGTKLAAVLASGGLQIPALGDPADSGSYVVLNPTGTDNGAVLIGTRVTTNKGLIIKGAASQTANLQEWQNSGGAAGMAIGADRQLKWMNSGHEQTTVGAAGTAAALPLLPTKYLQVRDSAGTLLVIPAYLAA